MSLDWLLATLLVLLVLTALWVRDLMWAIVSFITFGLVMVLVWSRLEAPDLALTEAAIGTGLMTLFLLDSLGFALSSERPGKEHPGKERSLETASWSRVLLLGGGGVLVFALLGAWLRSWPPHPGLGRLVEQSLGQSGVDYQVTAVLLNFRFFDTWFEITVFWLSILALLSVRGRPSVGSELQTRKRDSIRVWLIRLLFSPTVLFAVYLLWRGKHAAGGAFQAGAVMGAGLCLLAITGTSVFLLRSPTWTRLAVAVGVGGFCAAAALTLGLGRELGEYPPRQAGDLILLVESLAAFSIAMSVPYLFAALQLPGHGEASEEEQK